ncbi:MAG: ABC transporter ATP-binding protein [Culicoidibacterales bacterium]
MSTIIEVKDVTKKFRRTEKKKGLKGAFLGLIRPVYKEKVAVDHLSFSIKEGEIVGFIGANGAGKSTTIKMMTGILYPTSGEVIVDGIIPYEKRIDNARKIGVVFGQRTQLIWDIALEESLMMQQHIYGVDEEVFKERLAYFVEKLELQDLLRVPIRQMSLGQKMRSELAAAFLHKPKLVYLDEPTIGLDVKVKETIREFIREMNEKDNTTVILTTHDMQDIEALVERVIIIDQGQKLYDGAIDSLSKQFGNKKVLTIELAKECDLVMDDEIRQQLLTVEEKEDKWYLSYSQNDIQTPMLMSHLFLNNEIIDFTVNDEPIEEIVKVIYEQKEVIG